MAARTAGCARWVVWGIGNGQGPGQAQCGTQYVEAVRAETVGDGGPDQRAHHEQSAVGRERPPERVRGLPRDHHAVDAEEPETHKSDQRPRALPQPAPHHPDSTDLRDTRQDIERQRADDPQARSRPRDEHGDRVESGRVLVATHADFEATGLHV